MIKEIQIKNYKSIKNQKVRLSNINILIGGNGVGKSNFISVFRLLKDIVNKNLESFVINKGGANKILYLGRKISKEIEISIVSNNNKYSCWLIPNENNNLLYFNNEMVSFKINIGKKEWYDEIILNRTTVTKIYDKNTQVARYTSKEFSNFNIYHFHDTSSSAGVKQFCDVYDNRYLNPDASNLAAYLYLLQQKHHNIFLRIEDTLKIIAPYFKQFNLVVNELNNQIQIEWNEYNSDVLYNTHDFSDGTLRMLCLITLFLQPNPPQVIIIDEPELGLHPQAIQLLASIIESVSDRIQIIIATQSVTLINQFLPENIIIADRIDNETVLKNLNDQELGAWLENYTIGELWEKNVIGGR